MTGQLVWTPTLTGEILNQQYGTLREERIGHPSPLRRERIRPRLDAVVRQIERCHVSYNLLILDDGSYVRIAPDQRPSPGTQVGVDPPDPVQAPLRGR